MSIKKFKEIEFYLYNYKKLDKMIQEIEEKYIESINGGTASWLRSQKGTGHILEDQVIKMMEDKKILKYKKWQAFLDRMLVFLCQKHPKLYRFTVMKYIEQQENSYIKEKLDISNKEMRRIRNVTLNCFLSKGMKEDLIRRY